MAPPPKPPHLKAIAGTTRKSDKERAASTLSYAVLEHLPPPPDWLTNAHARHEWMRLGPSLIANRLLTDVSISAFANLCAIHGVCVTSWAEGRMPHPQIMTQFRQLSNDFGLTPLSQGRIKAPEKETPANPFNRNGNRAA